MDNSYWNDCSIIECLIGHYRSKAINTLYYSMKHLLLKRFATMIQNTYGAHTLTIFKVMLRGDWSHVSTNDFQFVPHVMYSSWSAFGIDISTPDRSLTLPVLWMCTRLCILHTLELCINNGGILNEITWNVLQFWLRAYYFILILTFAKCKMNIKN